MFFSEGGADIGAAGTAHWCCWCSVACYAVLMGHRICRRGKAQITAIRFYAGAKAPFSCEPDTVEVLAGGSLALSSGPVRNPEGKLTAKFTSIWRRTTANTWEIVFDKGNAECDCKPPP